MTGTLWTRLRRTLGGRHARAHDDAPPADRPLAGVFSAYAPFGDAPAPWADDPHEQVRHYRHWVYAAVRAIATRVAGTPLGFVRTDTGEPLDADHPLPRLMAEVNPFDTAVTLWTRTLIHLELTGNAYWYVPANAVGRTAAIWLLPSQHMRVLPDRRRFVAGYLFSANGAEERFAREEIVHLKYPAPDSAHYGRGPLQAAAGSVDSHEAMKTAERRSFANGHFPGLAVQTGEKLSADVRTRLETALRRGFGGPDRAGRALILEQGLTVRPFTFSPREMDFLESSRMTRDEILAVFGVPAAVAGVSEDVNRASAEAMLYTFAENTILPKLRLLEAQLTQDLCRRFDPRIAARFESPLPRVRSEERADMIARLKHGVTTVNEERARIGLAPRPDGDRRAAPGGRAPAPQKAPPQAETPPETAPPERGTNGTPPRAGAARSASDAPAGVRTAGAPVTLVATPHATGAADATAAPPRIRPATAGVEAAVRSVLAGQARRIRQAGRPAEPTPDAAAARVLADPQEPGRLVAPLVPPVTAALEPLEPDAAVRKARAREAAPALADRMIGAARDAFARNERADITPEAVYAAAVVGPAVAAARDLVRRLAAPANGAAGPQQDA